MEFKKYQHLERIGTTEVDGLLDGKCFIFPKIDGSNASIWIDEKGNIQAGSRKRHLSLDNDLNGFYDWVLKQENLIQYLKDNPTHRLFGEWLTPHTIKHYNNDAWKKFYIFDVAIDLPEIPSGNKFEYIDYETYSEELDKYGIEYVPAICYVENPTYDFLTEQLDKTTYLIDNPEHKGEGVVIKRYDFKNRFGRTTWAKLVSSEFKTTHAKTFGVNKAIVKKMIEESIVDDFVTESLCKKVYAKINSENGLSSKDIPRLLNTVFYDLIKEESWNFVKKYKNPKIDFKTLQALTFRKCKTYFPELF